MTTRTTTRSKPTPARAAQPAKTMAAAIEKNSASTVVELPQPAAKPAANKPATNKPASSAKPAAPVCAPSAAELARQAGLSPAELQVLQSLGVKLTVSAA